MPRLLPHVVPCNMRPRLPSAYDAYRTNRRDGRQLLPCSRSHARAQLHKPHSESSCILRPNPGSWIGNHGPSHFEFPFVAEPWSAPLPTRDDPIFLREKRNRYAVRPAAQSISYSRPVTAAPDVRDPLSYETQVQSKSRVRGLLPPTAHRIPRPNEQLSELQIPVLRPHFLHACA